MGCFGKCGCADCCMSDAELNDIASSVTIEHTIYDQTATFSEGDCCHVAEIGDPDDYDNEIYCFVTNDIRVNESITTRSSFYRSKTYIPDPPIPTCVLTDFFSGPSFSEICDDVGSCGATVKTYEKIEKIAGFVRWKYGRTRVSVLKRLMQCPGFEEPQCKYVVECSIETLVQLGTLSKLAITKNSTIGGGDGCCHSSSGWEILPGDNQDLPAGSDCFWNETQPEPTFNCYGDEDDVLWGAVVSYWIRKFKVYDTADDIPSVINMDNDTSSNCSYEPCQDGGQELCVLIIGENLDPETGGNLVTVVTQTSCAYCIEMEPQCNSPACAEFSQNYCSCDPDGITRNNHTQGFAVGFDSFAYVNNPYAVNNGVCLYPRLVDAQASYILGRGEGCDNCDNHPLGYPGIGVPVDERTECNWFECFNCLTGDDPWISRLQPKQNTVDAYSFSSSAEEYTDIYCIPFPDVKLTLNP